MGNTPSSDGSRKVPRRTLQRQQSKARPSSNAVHDQPLVPGDSSALMSPRYSSFYLAGSLPPPVPERASTAIGSESASAAWNEASWDASGLGRHASWQHMEPVHMDAELRRANSMVNFDNGQSLSRSQSFRSYTNKEKRMSLHADMASYDAQRLGHLDQAFMQNLQIASAESHLEMHQSNDTSSWEADAYQQPTGPITRTDSDLSLHAPMRRRSAVQMPGVATRSQREAGPALNKRAFRKSQPLLSTEQTFNPDDFKPERCLSMPPPPVGFDSQPRALTPSDREYRQLGGMTFGSLRITNGSPAPSLDPEAERREYFRRADGRTNDHQGFVHRGETPSYTAIEPNATDYIGQPQYTTSEQHYYKEKTHDSLPAHSQLPSFNIEAPYDQPENVEQLRETSPHDSPETLDIREDPSAKASPADSQLKPNKKRNSVERSDSGFDSTSSTMSSRQTPSKADSGYSSSFSLRSFRNSYSKREESDRRLRDMSNKQLSNDKETQQIRSTGKITKAKIDPTPRNDRPKTSIQSSASSMSLRSLRRLSMNPSKTQRSDTLDSKKAPSTSHSRTRSMSAPRRSAIEEREEQDSSRPTSKRSGYKQGKFYRFLVGSKEDIVPPEPGKHHICETIPDIPSCVEQRLQEHSERFPTAPQRLALRFEASKETLLTIMSEEGSVDVGHGERASIDRPRQVETQSSQPVPNNRQQRLSLQTLLPTWHLNARKSIKRKPVASTAKEDNSEIRNEAVQGEPERNHRALSIPASVAEPDAKAHKRGPEPLMNPNPTAPIYLPTSQQSRRLSSRASTPNMRETEIIPPTPSMPDLSMRRKTKTPPPVSMRTRSMKRRETPPPVPSQPSPVDMLPSQWASPPQRESSEDLRAHVSYDATPQMQDQWSTNSRPQGYSRHAASHGTERGHQPVFFHENCRTADRRDSGGRAATWNALHGYNSSAYQEVPVWG